ncbi:hypothetical protein [Nocardia puris]|nr:hypothetical protein [Nocardia puris]
MASLRARQRAYHASAGWWPFVADLVPPALVLLLMLALAVGWVR